MMIAHATITATPAPSVTTYYSLPYHQPTTHEVHTRDLPNWADESYLNTWFSPAAQVLSIKVIRNKLSGQPEGYGFVEFPSHAIAERILQTYNAAQIPGTELRYLQHHDHRIVRITVS